MHQTALKLVYPKPAKKKKQEITSKELLEFLKDKRLTCTCGHHFSIHSLSNTLIVYNDGTTQCHN